MSWTAKQKQIAVVACRQAGIDDAMRKLILRQIPHALVDGEPTSTSRKVTNADFERFMAIVEQRAGGQLKGWKPMYWQSKAGGRSHQASERQAHRIRELYDQFCRQGDGGLAGHGIYGLDGLVRNVTGGRTADLEEMSPREGHNMIEMLQAMIRRRGPVDDAPRERQQRMFAEQELPF